MRSGLLSIIVLGMGLVSATTTEAQIPVSPSLAAPRLRPTGITLVTVVREATARSRTFRGLVETIERSDGLVYVEEGDCGHGVRACLATVIVAGPNRVLRVRLDGRRADWDLMGSIGHELRHAVEVLGDPTITSNATMYLFYERHGLRRGSAFETDAAIQAGNDVRDEIRRPAVKAR